MQEPLMLIERERDILFSLLLKEIEKNMNSEEKAELLQALAKEGVTVEFHYEK